MKGYNSLKEYMQDYKMYLAVEKMDPGRESDTMTSFFKNRIKTRLKNSSASFKAMLKKNDFSEQDLKLIATHDLMDDMDSVHKFIRELLQVFIVRLNLSAYQAVWQRAYALRHSFM